MLTEVQRLVVTLIAQTLFYGIYLETLIQCLRWLIFTDEGWKPREKINSLIMTFATGFIFLTSTSNLLTSLQDVLKISRRDEGWQLKDIGIAMTISESLTLLSVDYILIYRCWIVYAKSWRVICLPVTFWLGLLACCSYYGAVNSSSDPNAFKIEDVVLIALSVCNIATTVYTTSTRFLVDDFGSYYYLCNGSAAIIYRIWCTSRKTSGSSPKRLNHIMRILAESGILYTCTIIFRLAALVLVFPNDASWVNHFINDISDAINFSMAGISFNLLLIRVYQSRIERQDSLADSRHVDGGCPPTRDKWMRRLMKYKSTVEAVTEVERM
ncbi:hypothetical protein JOM56_005464 [Amanita muscaria]